MSSACQPLNRRGEGLRPEAMGVETATTVPVVAGHRPEVVAVVGQEEEIMATTTTTFPDKIIIEERDEDAINNRRMTAQECATRYEQRFRCFLHNYIGCFLFCFRLAHSVLLHLSKTRMF